MSGQESSASLLERVCRTCHTPKDIDEFGADKAKPDGKSTRCKQCDREKTARWRAQDPEHAHALGRQHDRKRRALNPEKLREKNRKGYKQWRAQDPEHARMIARRSNARFRAKNPEHARALGRKSDQKRRLLHGEKLREQKQRRYRANILHKRLLNNQSARRRRQANPEQYRLKALMDTERRRARKLQAPLNDLILPQWQAIQAMQDHRCYYCGKRCKGKLTQDHILPLSRGGSHTLHNVIAACRSCNCSKHAGPPPKPVQPFLLTAV